MAVLVVDDKGTQLSYIDSGPIQNDTYATLFLLHGHTFYSPIFNRLHPLSTKYNVRIVAITRRDYQGSTPFTSIELDVITRGDTAAKTEFLKARAVEIATFLDSFTQQNNLPKVSADGSRGGIVLLGWSLGNVQALSVVGLARYLPRDLSDRLEPYFKGIILYECPYHSLGFLPPPKAYHPLRDPTILQKEKNSRFISWVSGYFMHQGLDTHDVDVLEYISPSQHRRPTTTALSGEELAAMTDTAPGTRSEDPFFVGSDPQMMGHIREQVFFPGTGDSVVWPRLKVACVWGTETTWSIPCASWMLEQYVNDESLKIHGKHSMQRQLDIYPVPGVNHFAHWDDSEKLMQALSRAMK